MRNLKMIYITFFLDIGNIFSNRFGIDEFEVFWKNQVMSIQGQTVYPNLEAKTELSGEEGLARKFVFYTYVIPSMAHNFIKYIASIVISSLPFEKGVWDALQGENAMQILTNTLVSKDYDKAVDILLEKAKKTLSTLQLLKLNIATITAGIAINTIYCWGN